MRFIVTIAVVAQTLEALRSRGMSRKECVVFWLAPRRDRNVCRVSEIYIPAQEAQTDYFRIGHEAMRELMRYLRARGLALVAQVHSHPQEAFHSEVDDEWAVVRHEGALSVVVPYFARNTTPSEFSSDAAFFTLSHDDKWLEVKPADLSKVFEIAQ